MRCIFFTLLYQIYDKPLYLYLQGIGCRVLGTLKSTV